MPIPYFVHKKENLKLELKDFREYVVVYLNGQQILKTEKEKPPLIIPFTNGLKRSDKESVHLLKIELWNKKPGHFLEAAIYSTGINKEETSVRQFKSKESILPNEEENITEYYLSLVTLNKPSGLIQTEEFYFQFD